MSTIHRRGVLLDGIGKELVRSANGGARKTLSAWIADLQDSIELEDLAETFTSGDATPDVSASSKWITAGSTAITNFDGGTEGQVIHIYRGNSDIVITDNATIDPIISGNLTLSATRPSASFRLASGVWKQIEESGAVSSAMTPVVQAATTDAGLGALNGVLEVATKAALSALTGGVVDAVYLRARTTAGDGGGGLFYWNSANLSSQVTADTLGGVYVAPDAASTGASGAWVRLYEHLDPRYFGATMYETDTLAEAGVESNDEVQACVSFTRSVQGEMRLRGFFKLTEQIDAHPSSPYTMRGDGERSSGFVVVITDRAKAGLKLTHPSVASTRGLGCLIEKFKMTAGVGCKAAAIDDRYSTDVKVRHCWFSWYEAGASALRVSNAWNSDYGLNRVWGAGAQRVSKTIADGVTFSITNGGTTLEASASVFDAGDVGKRITLDDGSLVPQTFTIAAHTDGDTVTVDTARRAFTAVRGDFGTIRGDTTATSTTVTVEEGRFTSDDIGRVVYIPYAGAARTNSGRWPHRAKIAAVPGAAEITLDTAAVATVSDVPIILDPAVDVYFEGAADQLTNDFSFIDSAIEEFRGCGLVVMNAVHCRLNSTKIHSTGQATGGINDATAEACAMLIEVGGHIDEMDLEQKLVGHYGRLITFASASSEPTIDKIDTVGQYGLPTVYMGGGSSVGRIAVGYINMANAVDANLPTYSQQLVTDGTTAAPILLGGIHAYTGSAVSPRFPVGIQIGTGGDTLSVYDEGTFTPAFTFGTPGDVDITYTAQLGSYTRIGNRIFFDITLAFSTNAYTTSSGQARITGLPSAALAGGRHYPVFIGRAENLEIGTDIQFSGVIFGGAQTLDFVGVADSGTTTYYSTGQFPASTSYVMEIAGNYRVA